MLLFNIFWICCQCPSSRIVLCSVLTFLLSQNCSYFLKSSLSQKRHQWVLANHHHAQRRARSSLQLADETFGAISRFEEANSLRRAPALGRPSQSHEDLVHTLVVNFAHAFALPSSSPRDALRSAQATPRKARDDTTIRHSAKAFGRSSIKCTRWASSTSACPRQCAGKSPQSLPCVRVRAASPRAWRDA